MKERSVWAVSYTHLIAENLVDEYIFGVVPIILGKGIPLFRHNNPAIPLTLKEYFVEDGICVLHYVKS